MGEVGKFGIADVLTIVGLLATVVLAAIGGAAGWFRNSNRTRDARTGSLETRMTNYEEVRNAQALQLNTLKICQDNINDKLEEIKVDISNSAVRGARSVNEQLAMVMNEVQKLGSHMKGRHD